MSEQETEPATKICPFCAEQILADARKCRYCGEFLVAQKEKSGIESLYQMLAITGSLLLVIAPFAPLASAPIVGRITLFNKGQGDGIVLLVVAVVSLVLALFRHYGFLWLSGTIGIFAFGNLLFFFYHRLPEIIHDYNAETRGNPFNSIGQIGLANFDADWGVAVLLLGTILSLVVIVSVRVKNGRLEPGEIIGAYLVLFVAVCWILLYITDLVYWAKLLYEVIMSRFD